MSKKKDRELAKLHRHRTVSAGGYARCPSGHERVQLSSGEDAQGKYLDAACREPGCTSKPQRFRDEGREV